MHTIDDPCVPFVQPFYEPLHPGSRINIHGRVEACEDDQFAVELLSGPHIVLHVNFRFCEHVLVLNAASHGCWGPEIRYDNPLHDGDHFHLHIHVHSSHYDIEVNGHHLAHFDHRFPYESVQALGVKGGLHVSSLKLEGFPFHSHWHHNSDSYDFGHGGYAGYGTSYYSPPEFHENHHHRRHFHHGY